MLTSVAAINNVKPTKQRQELPVSGGAPGFFLIVQPLPRGSKSFALRLRRPDGRTAKLTLGRVDLDKREANDDPVLGGTLTLRQARQLSTQIDRERARGVDVVARHQANKLAAADRAADSFTACAREFFIEYRTKRQTRPRRWREDAAILGLSYPVGSDPATTEPKIAKGSVASVWGNRPVAEINGHLIHSVVDQARKRSPNGARRLHSALSVMFGWLLRQRRVAVNPAVGVWRPGPPASRERVLSNAEVVIFWDACGRVGGTFGPLFKTLLLTGCRLREVSGMRRAEITDGVWTISGARTKNHRPLSLTLPLLVREIIHSIPVIEGKVEFVFSYKRSLTGLGFQQGQERTRC